MRIKPAYSFDDVLLVPKFSEIESRKDVSVRVDLGKDILLDFPIIPANMSDIVNASMAMEIAKMGGLAILHRFMSLNEIVAEYTKATAGLSALRKYIGFSCGVRDEDFNLVDTMCGKLGAKIALIDVAHGDHILAVEMANYISETFPEVLLIAGNICTGAGAETLVNAGAGSICTTRIQTGNGSPSITALSDVFEWRESEDLTFKIIADGGIKNSGDIVKALCFADAVMVGSLLAGANETPGEIIEQDGQRYKQYNGSSTHKTNHIEGVKSMVPVKGPVRSLINSLLEGVRSGCSYQGVSDIGDLQINPEFVSITHAGIIESNSHSVKVIK